MRQSGQDSLIETYRKSCGIIIIYFPINEAVNPPRRGRLELLVRRAKRKNQSSPRPSCLSFYHNIALVYNIVNLYT